MLVIAVSRAAEKFYHKPDHMSLLINTAASARWNELGVHVENRFNGFPETENR